MPRNVIVSGITLPAPALVELDGPWRIFATADAGGLSNLGPGRKATVVITIDELADLLAAVPAEEIYAGQPGAQETIRDAIKVLRTGK